MVVRVRVGATEADLVDSAKTKDHQQQPPTQTSSPRWRVRAIRAQLHTSPTLALHSPGSRLSYLAVVVVV